MKQNEMQHNYGIDLLRIMAMLMIVAHHFSLHSGIQCDTAFERSFMAVSALGGKTAVNVFVLITGYCSSGRIRKEKIANLFLTTSWYAMVLTAVAVFVGAVPISKKLLVKAALPLLFGDTYWFMVTYLELYLLIPILSSIAQSVDLHTAKRYLILFGVLLSILPTVAGRFIHVNDLGYNGLVWFIYLFYLGVYLRRANAASKLKYIYILMAFFAQIASCIALQRGVSVDILRLLLECIADYRANAISPLLISVLMLLGFQNMKITGGKKLLHIIGGATLGIYLFHDHVYFRNWLWTAVWALNSKLGLNTFAVNAVLTVFWVFIAGLCTELLRGYLFTKVSRRCPWSTGTENV